MSGLLKYNQEHGAGGQFGTTNNQQPQPTQEQVDAVNAANAETQAARDALATRRGAITGSSHNLKANDEPHYFGVNPNSGKQGIGYKQQHQKSRGGLQGSKRTQKLLKYSDDEARDDHGRWTSSGSSGQAKDDKKKVRMWKGVETKLTADTHLAADVKQATGLSAQDLGDKIFENTHLGAGHAELADVKKTAFGVRVMWNIASGQKGIEDGSLVRTWSMDGKSVYHDLFELPLAMQGTGIARQVLANSMDIYKKGGVDKVDVGAGMQNGGYTWAKFGFVPNEDSWYKIRTNREISSMAVRAEDSQREKMFAVLNDSNPKAMWKLSDMSEKYVGADGMHDDKSIAQKALLGRSWSGTLDLKDPEAMARFDHYVHPKGLGKMASLSTGKLNETELMQLLIDEVDSAPTLIKFQKAEYYYDPKVKRTFKKLPSGIGVDWQGKRPQVDKYAKAVKRWLDEIKVNAQKALRTKGKQRLTKAFNADQPRDDHGRWSATEGVPDEPGSKPIPEGDVRLYHQTTADAAEKIRSEGIKLSEAKGIEGPRAIYADEKGFYGKPGDVPTVEFHVPKEQWDKPFVRADKVDPKNIVAIHYPWHSHARYIEQDPKLTSEVVAGEHDSLLSDKDYGPAIRYIKSKHGTSKIAKADDDETDPINPDPDPEETRRQRRRARRAEQADEDEAEAERIAAEISDAIAMGDADLLIDDISEITSDAVRDGVDGLLGQIGLPDTDELFSRVDEYAVEFADARAAELVGMKWDGEELVENPDAEMAIDDTTRLMLRSAIADGLIDGFTMEEIASGLEDIFGFSSERAELIASTEINRAHSYGSLKAAKDARDDYNVQSTKEWLVADTPCPICEANNEDGLIPLDQAFDSGDDAPPAHPNAVFSGVGFVPYGRLEQVLRSRYHGPAITLRAVFDKNPVELAARYLRGLPNDFLRNISVEHIERHFQHIWGNGAGSTIAVSSGDYQITVGPNHPMLTRRGFLPANLVQESDELLYDLRTVALSVASDDEQVKLLEDAFEALAGAVGVVAAGGAATNFHGDEAFIYGKVDAVFPNHNLLPKLDAGIVQHLCECPLTGAYTSTSHLASCSTCKERFDRVFLTASGSVGSFSKPSPLSFIKGGPVTPETFGFVRLVVGSTHKTIFEGLAFDASTSQAIYNVGGIVVKNCRCAVAYHAKLPSEEQDTEDGDSEPSNADDEDDAINLMDKHLAILGETLLAELKGEPLLKYSEDQPRDDHGRWTGDGSSADKKVELPSKYTSGLPKDAVQNDNSWQALKAKAEVARDQLQSLLNKGSGIVSKMGGLTKDLPRTADGWKQLIAETTGKPVLFMGPLKGEARATEKVMKEAGGKWNSLLDVARASVAVDRPQDVGRVLKELSDHGVEIARAAKDRLNQALADGYRNDVLINPRMPNGHIVELQVGVKRMFEAKEQGHVIYERDRSITGKYTGKPESAWSDADKVAHSENVAQMKGLYERTWNEVMAESHIEKAEKIDPGNYFYVDVDGTIYRGTRQYMIVSDMWKDGAWVPSNLSTTEVLDSGPFCKSPE